MNKHKIANELDDYIKSKFGSQFSVDIDDENLNLKFGKLKVAWFEDFDADGINFQDVNTEVNILILKSKIIHEFYTKAVQLIEEDQERYSVQVIMNDYGFLQKLNDSYILGWLNNPYVWANPEDTRLKNSFTKAEIENMKNMSELSGIDWDWVKLKKI